MINSEWLQNADVCERVGGGQKANKDDGQGRSSRRGSTSVTELLNRG